MFRSAPVCKFLLLAAIFAPTGSAAMLGAGMDLRAALLADPNQDSILWGPLYMSSNDTTPISAAISGSADYYGTWMDQGGEHFGVVGTYSVDLEARARASYGELGIYVRNRTTMDSPYGLRPAQSYSAADVGAVFYDVVEVSAPDATSVQFIFEVTGASNICLESAYLGQPCPDPLPLTELTNFSLRIGGYPAEIAGQFPDNDMGVPPGLLWGVAGVNPDRSAELSAALLIDYAVCNGDHTCLPLEADLSFRLVGTQVLTGYSGDGTLALASDQRLYSNTPYPDVPTISAPPPPQPPDIVIPEPSTFWLAALALAFIAFRRI